MANTYTQLYVQIVFAVKGRQNLITEKHREKLEKFICGIITNLNSKPMAIYCNPDHIHILLSLNPRTSVSELTKAIKSNSSRMINASKWLCTRFSWQNGFGAFTYSKSQVLRVAKYIHNQPIHHKTSTFKEEYLALLEKYDIEYDDQYLFDWNEVK